MKNWIRKRIVLYSLRMNLVEAIGMNWWKKASNECRRIKRVKEL